MPKVTRPSKTSAGGGTEYVDGTTVEASENNADYAAVKTAVDGNDDSIIALQTEVNQMPGGAGPETLAISSGSITPTIANVIVNAAVSPTDLDVIDPTNFSAGRIILLRILSNAVTVKHNHAGTDPILLLGDVDFLMSNTEQRLWLQYDGTNWVEVARGGTEAIRAVGGAGNPPFQNSWSAASVALSFFKDASNTVHIFGGASKASLAAASSVVFALPAGYRPPDGVNAVMLGQDTSGSTFESMRVGVSAPGDVSVINDMTGTAGNDFTVFFHLSFPAAA